MEKILNILLVRRTETENKWWHRLINVLICGSTVLVAISSFFAVYSSLHWKNYTYNAYDFEKNYTSAVGNEISCVFNEVPPSLVCGGDQADTLDLISRYNQILREKYPMIASYCDSSKDKLAPTLNEQQLKENIDALLKGGLSQDQVQQYVNNYSKSSDGNYTLKRQPLTDQEFQCKNFAIIKSPDPSVDLYATYSSWMLQIGFRAKRTTIILYPTLVEHFLIWISIIFGWFIFWESIVYRISLYIIYGPKRNAE